MRKKVKPVTNKAYKVEIYRSWCKKCGICAAFCPLKVVKMDEEGAPTVTDPEKCKGCRLCELRCPDFAIRVKLDQEKTHSTVDPAEQSSPPDSDTEGFGHVEET